MREIKFRAWQKDQGCMYFTQSSLGTEGDGYIDRIDLAGKSIDLGCQDGDGDYVGQYDLSAVELMQFTGLKDKNGKEIYEGDIVKGEYVGFIRWSEKEAAFEHVDKVSEGYPRAGEEVINSLIMMRIFPYEVIGNVHENPELLK